MNYLEVKVPSAYKCNSCKVTGVKLWGEYQTFSPKLLCARCASNDQKKNIDKMDSTGRYPSDLDEALTDQIGWYVPAVPDEEGNYWGYTSVPDEAIKWWRNLPNRI